MTKKAEKGNMSPARKELDTSTYSGRFAVRLRFLREKAGLSHEELAEKVGVKPITVYTWELGTRAPNIADLPEIADALKLSGIRLLFPNK